MKRVLIITYYWPPSGGSGVQRWLKMSKYLPENGWQPVIYTPENPESPVEDPSLEADVCEEVEVVKRPILEPYSLYKRFVGVKKEQKVKVGFINEGEHKNSWKENLTLWIRGNLFIPDARCWWIKPSVKYLKEYLKEHPVDAIISTGPPHSMHLIGMKLHKALHIPWIADFRDPWTEIDYYDELHLSRWADRKHHRLEKEVLSKADKVVTVSWDWAKRLNRLGASDACTILNGFDWNDAEQDIQVDLPNSFTITYLGTLTKSQNPHLLWEAIHEICESNSDFSNTLNINIIGHVDSSVINDITINDLADKTTFTPYIPHAEVAKVQRNSTLLLLLLLHDTPRSKGLMTGKLFEYMTSGRPILCIGDEDGDAAKVIEESRTGVTIDFGDKGKMKECLIHLFGKHQSGDLYQKNEVTIAKYARKEQAKEFVSILNQLIPNQ